MKITRYCLLTIIALFVFRALSPVPAAAQSVATPTLGFTPAALDPLSRANPSDIDNIDLMTGALTLRIPLLSVGGRGTAGFTIDFRLTRQWTINRGMRLGNCVPSYNCSYIDEYSLSSGTTSGAHMTFGAGGLIARHAGYDSQVSCSWSPSAFDRMLTRLTFGAPDGSSTELVDAAFNGEPKGIDGDCTKGHSRGHVWYSTNGSGMTFISDAPIQDETTYRISTPSGNLMMKDGTKYRIDNGKVTSIRDRNGNIITISDVSSTGRRLITDPLKRVIEVKTSGSFGTPTTITYKGFGSENRTITFVDNINPALRPDFSSLHTHASAFPGIPNLLFPTQSVGTVTTVDRIILPDNRQYRLWFNNYGEIARVDLPTGGRVEYDYVAGPGAHPSGGVGGAFIYRRVATRRVYLNTTDTVPVTETRYTAVTSYSEGHVIVIVRQVIPGTETNLSYTKHYIHGSPIASYNLDPTDYRGWKDGLELKTEQYDASGTRLIRRIERDFQPRVTRNFTANPNIPRLVSFDPQLRSEVTTLADGSTKVSKKTFSYDQYNNMTEVNEYDFGASAPGPLIRRTQTTYLTTNPYQDNINYATDHNIHIRNLPTLVSIFDGNDNEVLRTHFDYDRYELYPLQDCPNIVQHDGGFDTEYATRGNLVKTAKVASFDPETKAPVSYIDNYFQYNIAGNAVKTIDGRTPAGITTLAFDDNFGGPDDDAQLKAKPTELGDGSTYAFPTKVTNALGHTTYTQYDYHLGKAVNVQDANGIVSSLAYDDALDRPTQSIQARYKVGVGVPIERRQTTTTYDDVSRVITTTTDFATFDDKKLTSKSYYDGLRRPWRSARYESDTSYEGDTSDEGDTWTIVDKQFDARGMVSQVSNPYRADDPDTASPPSDLWTKTFYDPLGRVVDVESPDGAHITTQYSANQVTVVDQSGKSRTNVIDPLGRLVEVTEDPAVLKYKTTYLYDPIGNLRHVKQGEQERWYSYDPLSRQIRARNPEQDCNPNLPSHTDPFTGGNCWSVAHKYDENGNPIETTDARGVKTKMTYDELNRIKSKVYEGTIQEGTEAGDVTPPVNFYYDDYSELEDLSGAPSWPGTPSKGRLIGVTYGGGSEGTYYKYRNDGSIVTNHQRQGTANYVTNYTYNPAGALTREERMGGSKVRRRNQISYDEAGRLLAIDASVFSGNGSDSSRLVGDISYTPFGALQSEKYGNGLVHSMEYNNRLQPTKIGLGTLDNMESVFRLNYIYGTAQNVNSQDSEIAAIQNNGNIARIKYFINGTLQYSQTQKYDSLNRLFYAVEHKNGMYNDASRAWYQTSEYDHLGNRGIDVYNTSDNADADNTALKLSEFSAATNRITRAGYKYDRNGNLIEEPEKKYFYNGANKLYKAIVGGVVTSQYFYNGIGQRVRTVVGGEATRFVYGAGGMLIEERNDSTSIVTKDYFYRGGELLATTKDGGGYEYATADHLGSPRAWTAGKDGNLTSLRRQDYMQFGEDLFAGVGTRTTEQGYAASGQQNGQRKQFTGYEKDDETGLNFAQARYYSSAQGRFTTPDIFGGRQANPQTLNLYAYTLNNPLKWVDPTGHFSQFYTPFQTQDEYCKKNDCLKPGDPRINDPTIKMEAEKAYEPPSTIVSIIPVVGSALEAKYYFDTGRPVWGAIYTGMAISDITGIKAGVSAIGKLGWKLFAKETVEETAEVVVKDVVAESSVKLERSFIRVGEEGKPAFQLQSSGEQGLSVFDPAGVTPPLTSGEILESFRAGSYTIERTAGQIDSVGLTVIKTEGAASLPPRLREAHREIRPGEGMTRKEFKNALKKLE